MASGTFRERELIQGMDMTIRIVRGPFHPILMRFGFWLMTAGARIAGVGHVDVVDDRAE